MESQTTEQMPRKKSVYNKERYEQNKEEILNDRREYIIIYYLLFIYYLSSKGRNSKRREVVRGTEAGRRDGRDTFSNKILRIEFFSNFQFQKENSF